MSVGEHVLEQPSVRLHGDPLARVLGRLVHDDRPRPLWRRSAARGDAEGRQLLAEA